MDNKKLYKIVYVLLFLAGALSILVGMIAAIEIISLLYMIFGILLLWYGDWINATYCGEIKP